MQDKDNGSNGIAKYGPMQRDKFMQQQCFVPCRSCNCSVPYTMAKPRRSEAVEKLLDISSTGGIYMGSPEDRSEDVGGIIHYEHIQLFVSNIERTLPTSFTASLALSMPQPAAAAIVSQGQVLSG